MGVNKSNGNINNFFSALWVTAVIVGFFATFGITTSTQTASAADLSQFQAGNIISDSVFYNGNSMTSSEVQNFLNQKVPTCTINNGQPSHAAGAAWGSTTISDTCLKSYSQTTPSMAAQPGICAAYPGGNSESAATIIAKIGNACGVSQKVLLVLLEKEQSLISDSWPTVRQINQATGFACYDNGQPCVQDYAGFFYQVWSAARQLQRYGTAPFTWYPVGQTSNILYQANRPECGTKSVYIQNRATAALYYYTPYTPNAAALAAGYGTGDACSAYGNRNFFQLYTDWFGSTQGFDVSGPIGEKYQQIGAQNSWLGAAVGNQACGLRDNGCIQVFQNGYMMWTAATGAHPVNREVAAVWARYSNERGALGYPTGDPGTPGSTYTQTFQGGNISAAGGSASLVVANDPFQTAITNASWLGAAVGQKTCGLRDNGCIQVFQNGYMMWTAATGAHPVNREVAAVWARYSNERGALGYPTGDPGTPGSTYTQTFQGGNISAAGGSASLVVANDPFQTAITNASWLGAAVGQKTCGLRDNGCIQVFQNGYMMWTAATGAHPVNREVAAVWARYSNERGALGYPTGDPGTPGSTYTQTFQGGNISAAGGSASLVVANDPFQTAITNASWLGAAVGQKTCGLRDNGCIQVFQNGYMMWTAATGAHPVNREVAAVWARYSNERGALGYPTGDPGTPGSTYTQTFQGGNISAAGGSASLVVANDPFQTAITNASWLGAAVGQKTCGLRDNGCIQVFQNGYMMWTAATGAHPVNREVAAVWARYSNERGALGYPTGDPGTPGSTYTQTFQGGTFSVSNGVARVQ